MKEILERIEMYYNRMNNCSSTTGKRNNGEQIIFILEKYPKAKIYWDYDPYRRAWSDRFRKIKEYSDGLDNYLTNNIFNIKNGIVIDEITDLKKAPSIRGVYLLGNCTCNPFTGQKQYWVKVGKAKDIYNRMTAYSTCCPCTALLDTLETTHETSIENLCQNILSENSVGRCQINTEWWLVDEETYKNISINKFDYFKNNNNLGIKSIVSSLMSM